MDIDGAVKRLRDIGLCVTRSDDNFFGGFGLTVVDGVRLMDCNFRVHSSAGGWRVSMPHLYPDDITYHMYLKDAVLAVIDGFRL